MKRDQRNDKIKAAAIIPAAGKGIRFKSKKKKPFTKLGGRPLLSYALQAFQNCSLIKDIVLVIDKPQLYRASVMVKHYGVTKVRHIVEGGKTRTDSVRRGLRCIGPDVSCIVVHDGVRPFVNKKIIRRSIGAAMKCGASVAAVPVKATIKVAKKGDWVKYTPQRKGLWEAQTPQVFRKKILEKAYQAAYKRKGRRGLFARPLRPDPARGGRARAGAGFTDDAALVEKIGARVKIVRGDYDNIKITTIEDMKVAEALLASGRTA